MVNVTKVECPEDLHCISQTGIAAAIWSRRPLPRFQAWMDGLSVNQLPKARVILPLDKIRKVLSEIMDVCGTPRCNLREILADDMEALCTIFGNLTGSYYLSLCLETVTTDYSCGEFHINTFNERLFCTYRGEGIQYGFSIKGREPQRIRTVPTGAPIVLGGKLLSTDQKSRFVHRFPKIGGIGETHLLLMLDPADTITCKLKALHSSIH